MACAASQTWTRRGVPAVRSVSEPPGAQLGGLAVRPLLARVAAPQQPGDEPGRRIGVGVPFVRADLLVDLVPGEVAVHRLDVGLGYLAALDELVRASDPDMRTAPPELFAQAQPALGSR